MYVQYFSFTPYVALVLCTIPNLKYVQTKLKLYDSK